jgi:hypothetical protein
MDDGERARLGELMARLDAVLDAMNDDADIHRAQRSAAMEAPPAEDRGQDDLVPNPPARRKTRS